MKTLTHTLIAAAGIIAATVSAAPAQAAYDGRELADRSDEICHETLGWASCLSYDTQIEKIDDDSLGYIEPVYTENWIPWIDERSVAVDGVTLDLDLINYTDERYVDHVIAHEWEHVATTRVHNTQSAFEDFNDAADEYYGVSQRQGAEIVVECASYGYGYNDFVPNSGTHIQCADWQQFYQPLN